MPRRFIALIAAAGALLLVAYFVTKERHGESGAPTDSADSRDNAARVASESLSAPADDDADESEFEDPAARVALDAMYREKSVAHGLAVLLDLDAAGGEFAEGVEDEEERFFHRDVLASVLLALGEHRRAEALAVVEAELRGRPEADGAPALFDATSARPAIETILDAARERRVVMLDGDPHSSVQRALLCELIDGFADLGFTHLCVEALDHHSLSAIEADGHVHQDHGPQLRDPVLAHALRHARARGLVLFAHDRVHRGVRPVLGIADRTTRDNYREECAALHLADLLDADPKHRLVVFTSRGRLDEAASGALIPIGARVSQLAKLDPLTIDCTSQGSSADRALESAAYQRARELGVLGRDAIVFVDADGKPWSSAPGALDFSVFHAPTHFDEELGGRPHFLRLGGLRKPVSVELDAAKLARSEPAPAEPALLVARVVDAPESAVPADQVVLRANAPTPPLLLAPGEYDVEVVDASGAVLFSERRVVD